MQWKLNYFLLRLPPEKRSLRAYVSILYADPRMKVYIQSRKVQTKRLLDSLYATKRYNFASKTFRTRAERDLAKAKSDVKVGKILLINLIFYATLRACVCLWVVCRSIAELRAKEAESKARDCELRYEDSKDPEHLVSLYFFNLLPFVCVVCILVWFENARNHYFQLKRLKNVVFQIFVSSLIIWVGVVGICNQ